MFWVTSTSKLWLASSTPGAWNFTEYAVQYWQDFAKSSKQLSSNKMIRQKIAAYIFGTTKNNLLKCQCYSVTSRFEVFSDSVIYILLLRNLTIDHFTFINALSLFGRDIHRISDWYIIVIKELTKFTVEVNCRFKTL